MICQTTKTKFALLVTMMMAIYAYVYPSPPPISGPIVAIHMAMMTMMTVMMRICVYDVNRANSTRRLSQFLGLRGGFLKGGGSGQRMDNDSALFWMDWKTNAKCHAHKTDGNRNDNDH